MNPSQFLRRIFGRRRKDADLALELESHLAHEIDDNLARGMNAAEARRLALMDLGNPLRVRDEVWESSRVAWLEDAWRDLRYAARNLRRAPSFTCVALLVMALGIGANTAIYSFLDALMLRSLPVSDPSSLVILKWHARPSQHDFVMQSMSGSVWDDPHWGSVSDIFPYPALSLAERSEHVFSNVFAYCHTREARAVNFSIHGQSEAASGELVSGRYFQGLGVDLGGRRIIKKKNYRAGAPAVVVVSYGFAERLGSGFRGCLPDFYAPLHTNILLGASDSFGFRAADYLDGNYYWLQIMARLRPGVTLAEAQAELQPKFHQWVAGTASNNQQRGNLPVLHLDKGAGGLDTLRRQFSKPFLVLMTLVVLILAIACSNVANLLLARASSRRREIALRLSQGASRSRVVRQLLTESVLLSCLGGALGLLFAVWGIRFLTALLPEQSGTLPSAVELSWRVLAMTAGVAVLTGVIFGLVPALQSTSVELTTALKETAGSRPLSGHVLFRSGRRARPVTMSQVLVVGQMAISLLILITAGLFVRTLSNLQSVDLGFNREDLLLFQVNARQSGHHDPEISEFYFRLREQLAAIPGVRDAGLARGSLIEGEDQMPIGLEGAPPDVANRYATVGPFFLTTMQIPILAGRDIDSHDRPGSQAVAVVNEEFVRRNFSGQTPLGHHLLLWKGVDGEVARDMEIVGVAKDAKYGSLKREIPPVIYLPFNQGFPLPNEMMFALRTRGDPIAYTSSIRDVVHRADPRLAVSEIRTEKLEVRDGMRQEIVLAELCSGFAGLALAIASVGIYGTISYTVARRTGEIGIRMALGAQRGPVLWMVLREVLILAGVGLAFSLPIALGTSRFVQSLLFGIRPNDPLALTLAIGALIAAALVAGGIPARRAARIDPMSALRHE